MRKTRLVAGRFPGCLWLFPIAAAAGAAAAGAADIVGAVGPKAAANEGSQASATLETIVVTGSYIRRTDTESPSPVDVITSDDILKRGMTNIADVIHSLSSDNSGTLTQNFSGAMAGGASGVSLRGLTVDATLVLVDGHRMATYPLADDGKRPFVDIGSLPLGIVDRVEVLKDGASAIYGSDAIAGVVNIITKKTFTGLDVSTNCPDDSQAARSAWWPDRFDRPACRSVQSGEPLLRGGAGLLRREFCQLHRQTGAILRRAHRHSRANHQVSNRRDSARGGPERSARRLGYGLERRLREGGDSADLHRRRSRPPIQSGPGQRRQSRQP